MQDLSDPEISDVIHMALNDHIAFSDIKEQYGLSESDVKKLMRKSLKSGSYRAWRKRVSRFSERRAHYK